MKKIVYVLFLAFCFQNYALDAQSCPGNLVADPSFDAGLTGGWAQFSSPAPWIKLAESGCVDTFILLGSGSNSQGGIEQNIAFTSSSCYDLCLCLSSTNFSRVRIFIATNDTAITSKKLRYNTYNPASAQLVDSIDVNGAAISYCKKGWVASANFSRLIIINTPQPVNGGAEVHVDNVCLTACSGGTSVKEQSAIENLKMINSSERLFVSLNNARFNAEITEITGKTVRTFTDVEHIDMSKDQLTPGIYILNIMKDNRLYSYKISF